MMLFSFLVFEWKYPFWANLVQKIKIVTLSWNLVPTLIRTCRIQWWCSFFLFLIGNTLFGQIWSKKSNYQLKLKFGSQTNSNMHNSMMLLTFFVFEWKYSFWANLVQKIKILTLSWNLVPTLIRTCRIQWWCLLFLYLIRNTLFVQIWSKKLKLSVETEIWYLD